jgi:hypothetical protein
VTYDQKPSGVWEGEWTLAILADGDPELASVAPLQVGKACRFSYAYLINDLRRQEPL